MLTDPFLLTFALAAPLACIPAAIAGARWERRHPALCPECLDRHTADAGCTPWH